MGCKVMRLDEKLDLFLMSEAVSVKLTPYAKSYIRLQDVWTKDELDTIVTKLAKNAGDKKYEVTFGKDGSLAIYRRGDDVVLRKMSPEDKKNLKAEITNLVKGSGLKVTGDAKSADWMSVIVSK